MLNLNQLKNYLILMRFHKPIGIFLLLWPTLWALWLASKGLPQIKLIVIFTLGTILMRAAGCIINDIADRNFDMHVARTQDRPLTAGRVSLTEAIILFGVFSLLAFALVLLLNRLTILLAFVGIALTIIYPFMKRFTHLPQAFLGISFAWGIPMAYAAVSNTVPVQAWLLYASVIAWVIAYDTEYAMADRDDDLKIGIKSTAILFGRFDIVAIHTLQGLFLIGLIIIGWQLNEFFYASLCAAVALFIYQNYLIKHREPKRCLQAFLNNNYVGLIIFIGIACQGW